jgi:signal transduction histidine kinase
MLELIGRLLDSARLDAGQALALEPHPEHLGGLLAEALAHIEPQATARAVRLERHLDADFQVSCDRVRILQVLANLLGNAVKFTPEGGMVRLEATRAQGMAHVRVRDTGPGIPPEAQAHIFERHWQAGGQDAPLGSGLGLYIARGLIQAHGGHIWVESAVGNGSTFAFTLPLVEA